MSDAADAADEIADDMLAAEIEGDYDERVRSLANQLRTFAEHGERWATYAVEQGAGTRRPARTRLMRWVRKLSG